MFNNKFDRVNSTTRLLMSGIFAGLGPMVLGIPAALARTEKPSVLDDETTVFKLKLDVPVIKSKRIQ